MDSTQKDKQNRVYSEEELVNYLLSTTEDSRRDFSLFAIRGLKHYHSPKIVDRLVKIIQEDPEPLKKVEAIKSISVKKPNQYIKQVVLDELKSEDERVRSAAAELLKFYNDTIVNDLHSLLNKDLPEYTKTKIIWLLGHVGNQSSIDILTKRKFVEAKEFKDSVEDTITSIKQKYVKLSIDELRKKSEEE
ncbi:MAG: HEAT repeat domain-containing protein [Candidatus Heimdallarchaeota archaeon]|nr:HEAT repeat domain-containing protein [Candidatus Heimdallarchaeota archaeon]MCK4875946.1 HEAT repeat domain-containing protein [Candidatus Heimdallarchaeota archaeon]